MKFSFLYLLFILYFTITSSTQLESEARKKKNRRRIRSSIRRFDNSIKYPMHEFSGNDDMTMNFMRPTGYPSASYDYEENKNEFTNFMQTSDRFSDTSNGNSFRNLNYVKGTPGETSPVFESFKYKTVSRNYQEPTVEESAPNFLIMKEKILDKNGSENKPSGLVFSSNQMEEDSTTTYRKAIVIGEVNNTTNTNYDVNNENFSDKSSKVDANTHENKTDYYIPSILKELNETINIVVPTNQTDIEKFRVNISNKNVSNHSHISLLPMSIPNLNNSTKSSNFVQTTSSNHDEIINQILNYLKRVFLDTDTGNVNYVKRFKENDYVIDVRINHIKDEHSENITNHNFQKSKNNSYALVNQKNPAMNMIKHQEEKKLGEEFIYQRYELNKSKEIVQIGSLKKRNLNLTRVKGEFGKKNEAGIISKMLEKSQVINQNKDVNKLLKIDIEKREKKSDNLLQHPYEKIFPKVEMNLNMTEEKANFYPNEKRNSSLKIHDNILNKTGDLIENQQTNKNQHDNLLKKFFESDSMKKSDEANIKSISLQNKISEKTLSKNQTSLPNKTETEKKTEKHLPHLFDMFKDDYIKTLENNSIKSETKTNSLQLESNSKAKEIVTNLNTTTESKYSQSKLRKLLHEDHLNKAVVAESQSKSIKRELDVKRDESKIPHKNQNLDINAKSLQDKSNDKPLDIKFFSSSSSTKPIEKTHSNLNQERIDIETVKEKSKYETNPKYPSATSKSVDNISSKQSNLDSRTTPLLNQTQKDSKPESQPSSVLSDFLPTDILSDKKESFILPNYKQNYQQSESKSLKSETKSKKEIEVNPIHEIVVPKVFTKETEEPPKTFTLSENKIISIPQTKIPTSTSQIFNNSILTHTNPTEMNNLSNYLEQIKMITQKIESRKKTLIKDKNIRKNSHKYLSLTDEFIGNAFDDENNDNKIEYNDLSKESNEAIKIKQSENDSAFSNESNKNLRKLENPIQDKPKENIENLSDTNSDNKKSTMKVILEKEEIDDNSLISEFLSKKKKR